ncbi:DUF982 domain-containing protein [Kumtagia ephedrae]|jgi:hypothetical protein|uniref:DUF982 domain-containing protein n=1 Tax=Kumtagia ephedrae TaxID=2116701 RepID=A0A2P7RXT1_9HYPH|nr:DUF982 domain-containing protein [Mesorhizobium ephedrae]PSJ54999.1 DUF982 domain-containing protein [Mesorhizobium ephedrae]
MPDKRFDRPIYVRNGTYLVQEIADLQDALYFLEDWPENRRGTIYETARRACCAAWDGHYPLDAARKAFEGWARMTKILENETPVMPWMTAPREGRGGVPA